MGVNVMSYSCLHIIGDHRRVYQIAGVLWETVLPPRTESELHVLPGPVRVRSRFFDFLPQSKNMSMSRLIGDSAGFMSYYC